MNANVTYWSAVVTEGLLRCSLTPIGFHGPIPRRCCCLEAAGAQSRVQDSSKGRILRVAVAPVRKLYGELLPIDLLLDFAFLLPNAIRQPRLTGAGRHRIRGTRDQGPKAQRLPDLGQARAANRAREGRPVCARCFSHDLNAWVIVPYFLAGREAPRGRSADQDSKFSPARVAGEMEHCNAPGELKSPDNAGFRA